MAPRVCSDDDLAAPMRGFALSLPMALLRAREAVMNDFRPSLHAHGINEQQWRVLRALFGSAEPIAVGELADRTLLLGPSLSRILAKLEENELIARESDIDDARRSYITITKTGREMVRSIAPDSEAAYAGIEQRFGKKRLQALLRELNDLSHLAVEPDEPEDLEPSR
jgi:homoprotocatechuate degradation regulator HpaR